MAGRRTPTSVHDVPDRVLSLVLLRLDTHVSFLRAAAACKRWRRIATAYDCYGYVPNFLRRHPGPHVLGHYHVVDPTISPGHPPGRRVVFVPAASSPAATSVDARRFSLDFLPRGRRSWDLIDGRGSLLLLANKRRGGLFPDLLVCEPITRRYVRIGPVEGMKYHRLLGAFLNSSCFDSNVYFRKPLDCRCSVSVILYEGYSWAAEEAGAVTACFYDGGCRGMKHRVTTSAAYGVHIPGVESAHFAGSSAGFAFWAIVGAGGSGTVLAAGKYHDRGFRLIHLPEDVRGSAFRFVDVHGVGYEHPALVRLVSLVGDELRLFLERRHDHGGGGSTWELQTSLRLREATCGLRGYKESFFFRSTAKIVVAGNGYVVLTPAEETWLFSVELGATTMAVERKHSRNRYAGEVYPYELASPPAVRACVVRCKRWGRGPCSHMCKCI